MITRYYYKDVEPVCYEPKHIEKIVSKLRQVFPSYFQDFLQTEGGAGITEKEFNRLKERFGVNSVKGINPRDDASRFKNILLESYEEFEKDRKAYLDILDSESLEEYEEDPYTFKSDVLRNQCPIIRKTINNKNAKELDKYRFEFTIADADYLLEVVRNICNEANYYLVNVYDSDTYESIDDLQDLQMDSFDTEECTAYGVIGGGIKSLMLHKFNPGVFSSRSRNALWALWYLTEKEDFGCETDSEFLMIDVDKTITQQNYFYPYELFHFYAFEIYKMIKEKADELCVSLDTEYRYVIVDRFFDFVAEVHENEISTLKSQIKENVGAAYA